MTGRRKPWILALGATIGFLIGIIPMIPIGGWSAECEPGVDCVTDATTFLGGFWLANGWSVRQLSFGPAIGALLGLLVAAAITHRQTSIERR
jgi:hypothetical protein